MNHLPTYVILAVAVVVLLAVLHTTKDHFSSEKMIDDTNVRKTQEMKNSHYKQDTNHVRPNGHFDAPPLQGVKSPFRVNMWDSYVV
jgi:hypothetical protein